MYYINTLKLELSTAKTYEHNRLNEMSVFDKHQCHMAVKFGVFVHGDHSKLPTVMGQALSPIYLHKVDFA